MPELFRFLMENGMSDFGNMLFDGTLFGCSALSAKDENSNFLFGLPVGAMTVERTWNKGVKQPDYNKRRRYCLIQRLRLVMSSRKKFIHPVIIWI